MRRLHATGIGLGIAAVLVAASYGPSGVASDSIEGDEIVEYDRRPLSVNHVPDRLDITLNEVLVIGAEEADSTEYLFGSLTSVVPGPDGHIYVADRQTSNIRVFDPSGTYVRTLGRRGEGPGEFERIETMAFDASDYLLVWDASLRYRLTRLDPQTGEEIDTYAMAGRFDTGPASFQPGPSSDGQPTNIFLLHRQSPDDTRDDDRYFSVRGEDMSPVHATFGEHLRTQSIDRRVLYHPQR